MTLERKVELRMLCSAATPGPWKQKERVDLYSQPSVEHGTAWIEISKRTLSLDQQRGDAQFIAAAREALPELLDELDEKDREIERLQGIETAARNLINYQNSGADSDYLDWNKYFDNLLAALYADPVADEKNYCRMHYIPREIKND